MLTPMPPRWGARLAGVAVVLALGAYGWPQSTVPRRRPLAESLLRQLVDINTTLEQGTTAAAAAMRQQLLQAGFPASDVVLAGPNPKDQNLVVRYRGTGKAKPILLIGHLDVVPANPANWTTNPYRLVVKNGVYYGRGTQDMKEGDAIFVAALIRFRREGYKPDRDLIVALTAGEETGVDNGVDWLLHQRRDLIPAAYVINADSTAVVSVHGQPQYMAVDAAEKVYADFEFSTTNPGGHSSMPVPDNAIYHLADALARLQNYRFPVELSDVTRRYFRARLKIDRGQVAADERALLANPNDRSAVDRLSADPLFNGTLRTTCVATRLKAGEANNALPERATAVVNCRIMPGHSPAEIQKQLERVVADSNVSVRYLTDGGQTLAQAPTAVTPPPMPLDPSVIGPIERLTAAMFDGIPVIPDLSLGASDGKYTNAAGLPTYCFSGIAIDRNNERAHGANENLPIPSFDTGAEYFYRLLKLLTGGHLDLPLPPASTR